MKSTQRNPIKIKLEFKKGNHTIGDDTIIYNMGSAIECPSKRLGLCKVGACYALKDELAYPDCKPYRDRQKAYWLKYDIRWMIPDFRRKINRLTFKPNFFRFNESGDFWTQQCVDKLSELAAYLQRAYQIVTYGFSARADLDFSKAQFLIKGSGHNNGNNGRAIVRKRWQIKGEKYYGKSEVYELCPMNCRTCFLCKEKNNVNVVFPEI